MDDDSREGDRCEEHLWASVVAGRDTPPIFEPVEHDLDAVSPFVTARVVFDRRLALLPTGDASAYPLVLQSFSEPVSVISTIPK